MSFNKGQLVPPVFTARIGIQIYQTRLVPMPLTGDVAGFSAGSDATLSQEQVDRATARLQQLIDSAPDDEQAVYAMLLDQAKAYADDHWPAG
jgi:hypothetical protein